MNTTEYQAFVINPSASKGVGLIQLKEFRGKWNEEAAYGVREIKPSKKEVSRFEMRMVGGMVHSISFVVTGDRPHGYVGEIEPMSRNSKELFEAMFKGWN